MNTIRTEILKLLETRSTPRAIYPGDDQYPMLRCLLEEHLPEEIPLRSNLGLPEVTTLAFLGQGVLDRA